MPSRAKNKKKDNGPTWDDEQAIRVLHHELETAATRAFRHPKIDPSAVYFSVLLGKKRSDPRAHERIRATHDANPLLPARCEGRRPDVHPTEAFNIVLLERHIMDMCRGLKAMKKEEARLKGKLYPIRIVHCVSANDMVLQR